MKFLPLLEKSAWFNGSMVQWFNGKSKMKKRSLAAIGVCIIKCNWRWSRNIFKMSENQLILNNSL